ncbi:MAG TPA: HAD family hydrolase [Candidatus Paceibacterota bacterium]|nr:HAD family hydrolase [Candidatus Paceibacterota bacterium]
MKLILLDLDNTLIDSDYKLNVLDTDFRAVIDRLAQSGVQVGLCSDSAAITLNQWALRLGLTGPVISERGAVIWNPVENSAEIIDVSDTNWFQRLREDFVVECMREFPGITIMLGDATRFVKSPGMNLAMTDDILAINGFRTASFSLFAFRPRSDQQGLEPNQDLLVKASNLIEKMLNRYSKNRDELFWDENPHYGVLILHANITVKSRAISRIIDRLKPVETVMIGDGLADFLDLPYVSQFAVANADPRYKAKASFVSAYPLARGVMECLAKYA